MTDEEMAEEYFETECLHSYADTEEQLKEDVVPAFLKGAKFGYNKAKEEGKVVVEHFEAYGQCRDSRRIASLEAKNEELQKACDETQGLLDKQIEATYKLDKENAEQKKKIENLQKYLDTQNCYRECAETWVKLTEAKKIISNLYAICKDNHYPNTSVIMEQAEQFLKEERNVKSDS